MIDADALMARVEAMDPAGDRSAQRAELVGLLTTANREGRERITAELRDYPYAARRAIQSYAGLTDVLIRVAWHYVTQIEMPNPVPTTGEHVCIVAVGGYGRGEMAPFSDVDLLFLIPWKRTAWCESAIECMLYILWDLKLKVGQAVRTVDECIRLGMKDLTIRTALLEYRYLAGAEKMSRELRRRLWKDLFAKTGPEFVEAKLEEREERHRRNGGSRYLVEPNVKESKGGLRDLQTLFWIAKYLNRAETPEEMVRSGQFTEAEMKTFREAENFLWAARCQLHLVAGRPMETMTFDHQVDVAKRLGFMDTEGQRAVERFMQTYFTYARQVGELTRIFLTALEAEHVKRRPRVGRSLLHRFSLNTDNAPEGYALLNGRLDIGDTEAFLADPVNILRLFRTAMRTGYLIHPNTMRLVAANIHLIDDGLRNDPEANELFMQLLLDREDPERALRRMNEMGVLGAFIPDFGRIVAMMQYNMYHHYTVDEHTIQCIARLHDIERGALQEELPIASSILKQGVSRRILYVALLLHDIGKGRARPHSEVGAEIALQLCPRLGLAEDETETVAWLVRNHLVMSDFAQKRDLADARTVRDFANIVASPARLRLLTVLTVCDIWGVGPGVWNNWKAMLLRDLYRQAMEYLTGDTDSQSRPQRVDEAKQAFAAAVPDWSAEDIAAEQQRHYDSFWLGLGTAEHVVLAQLVREVSADKPVVRIDQDPARDASRACFAMPDHPGVFARIAGAVALCGADVRDARTYTTSDGVATCVFWIQDKDGHPFEESRLPRLRRMIQRTLSGEVVARDAFAERDRVKKREQAFVVPTEITFDNDGSEIYTMITVDTRDRPGLLYDLTRSLTATHMRISSAIIATYGEQAVDTFYVKDAFGLKVTSKSKQGQIAAALRNAIREGTERAEA
nr:[protein-PII] uridylyltransferase [Halovulum marinum]